MVMRRYIENLRHAQWWSVHDVELDHVTDIDMTTEIK